MRLLLHFGNFSDSCDRIVLVTNASVDQNVADLLEALQHASTNDVLSSEAKTYFARLVAAYAALIAGLTAEQLFTFLKRLMVESEVGSLENRRKNYLALAWRLHELSEIDLRTTEAQKIARDLVELVRTKSHRVLALPIPDEILRRDKGVVVDDVLNVLSLSADGYRTLRKHGPGAIRTLSRLQRLCEASNVPASLIPHMCSLKSDWDTGGAHTGIRSPLPIS